MRYLILAALSANMAFGQVDVHPSKSQDWAKGGPLVIGDRYQIRNLTMFDLIHAAYGIGPAAIAVGPAWLEWNRYDITARIKPGSTPDDENTLLQKILTDRFGLVLRREKRQVQAFGLTAGADPRLTQSSGTEPARCRTAAAGARQTYQCRNMSMAGFAEELRQIHNYIGNLNVVDLTELKGAWDFEFSYTPSLIAPGKITLFQALDNIHLHLTPVTVPDVVTVVARVDEVPTPNPPGVKEALAPKGPLEFEVADVMPSSPDSTSDSLWFMPGGRFNAFNVTLRRLISRAFDVPDTRIDGPDWLSALRFTITAKTGTWFAETARASGQGSLYEPESMDAMKTMLRTLLTERFRIVFHWESRPAPGWKLVSVKPKLKRADPGERTKIVNGQWDSSRPGMGPKDPRIAIPARDTLVTYQNMTMAQIAANFQFSGKGPVRDATGLRGTWDLTMHFTTPGPRGLYLTDADGNPTGGITFDDALEQQAGLRIEKENRAEQFLVIERIEKTPTEN